MRKIIRQIPYTLYFFLFCIIDQRVYTASGIDGTYEFFRNLTGIPMALLIWGHYKTEDIRKLKKPYLAWSIVGGTAAIAALIWGISHEPFYAGWFLMVFDIFLFGYIIINTVHYLLREKNRLPVRKPMFLTWMVLMILMLLSRSDQTWPFFYLFMFGLFFLTSYTKEEQETIFQGILNGFILSFFAFQAYCCVFRPYDVVRYTGIYTNSNVASLYYLEVLVAVMVKYMQAAKKGAPLWIKAFYWLTLGVVFSFLFMCIGRTAWIVAIPLILIFLISLNIIQQKKRLLLHGIALFLCACIMFPLTFGIVRYVPPLFHHPVWFWGEWNEEKVHSWDPWDSEKYIDMDELLSAALGRFVKTFTDILENSPFALTAQAADTDTVVDKRAENAVLTLKESENGILVRKTIYSHYLKNLNLFGHPRTEQGFQLTENYWIGHAHNIYLQYGTDFGIIVLAVFIGFSLWVCAVLLQKFKRNHDPENIGYFMFALIPLTFGMLEFCWGICSLSILMLFMAWGCAMRNP